MKTIHIGDVFGELREVQVEDSANLKTALQIAGINLTRTQSVLAQSTSSNVEEADLLADGEYYLITSNHVSG